MFKFCIVKWNVFNLNSSSLKEIKNSSSWLHKCSALQNCYIVCMCMFLSDEEFFRLCLCTKQTGDHSIWRESWVASGHCKNLSERERLCARWQVWAHLWNAYNLPHLPLYCYAHNCLCTAFCHHSHPEVHFFLPVSPSLFLSVLTGLFFFLHNFTCIV